MSRYGSHGQFLIHPVIIANIFLLLNFILHVTSGKPSKESKMIKMSWEDACYDSIDATQSLNVKDYL